MSTIIGGQINSRNGPVLLDSHPSVPTEEKVSRRNERLGMRVLHWLNSYLPELGGIQTLCAQLLPTLRDEFGHEVEMLAGQGRQQMPSRCEQDSFVVHREPYMQALSSGDPMKIIHNRRRLGEIIDAYAPDILHMHPCGGELGYLSQLNKSRQLPVVMTMHNNYSQIISDLQATSFHKHGFSVADRIATVSTDASRYLLSEDPSLGSRTVVVPNGIVEMECTPAPISWDPPTLLYAGRLAPQKQLDVLINAFATVAAADEAVQLRLVGDGPERAALTALVQELGLSDRVSFLGQIEPESVVAELDRSTMVVMSSAFEGLPMFLLEAARHGRPVVSTNAGGVAEVVQHRYNGVVVEPGDTAGLATGIRELLGDRSLVEQYGRAGQRLFEERFTINACARAYDTIYREVLAERSMAE